MDVCACALEGGGGKWGVAGGGGGGGGRGRKGGWHLLQRASRRLLVSVQDPHLCVCVCVCVCVARVRVRVCSRHAACLSHGHVSHPSITGLDNGALLLTRTNGTHH